MKDYSNYPISNKGYGGVSCMKTGIRDMTNNYLVKFPNKLKDKNLKNVEISYANDIYSEYIASKFSSLFLPTHEVDLGIYKGKMCCICKDFLNAGVELIEYYKIQTTFYGSGSEDILIGGADLNEIIYILKSHNLTRNIPNIENIFWLMFIVDIMNGNPDRNNGNWGIIYSESTDKFDFAPVYDNGNSLSSKMSDNQMRECLEDKDRLNQIAYKGFRCFFTLNEKKVNPYQILESNKFNSATRVLLGMRLELYYNRYMRQIAGLIDSIESISEVRKRFYKEMYRLRLEELIRISSKLRK